MGGRRGSCRNMAGDLVEESLKQTRTPISAVTCHGGCAGVPPGGSSPGTPFMKDRPGSSLMSAGGRCSGSQEAFNPDIEWHGKSRSAMIGPRCLIALLPQEPAVVG